MEFWKERIEENLSEDARLQDEADMYYDEYRENSNYGMSENQMIDDLFFKNE